MRIVLSKSLFSNILGLNLKRFMFGVSFFALISNAGQALAECAPETPEEGDTVTCTGTTTDSVYYRVENVDFIVAEDAVFELGSGETLTVEAASGSFTNNGTIAFDTASSGYYYYSRLLQLGYRFGDPPVGSGGLVATNNGTIDSAGNYRAYVSIGAGVSRFENSETGVIDGNISFSSDFSGVFENKGQISLSDGLSFSSYRFQYNPPTLINAATGLIEGSYTQLISLRGLEFTNAGTISGANSYRTFNLDFGSHLVNEATGVIENDYMYGATVYGSSSSITNYGLIEGAGDAVSGWDLKVINHGNIVGDVRLFGEGAQLLNETGGVVTGDILSSWNPIFVENAGTINGDIQFSRSSDVYSYRGGMVSGNIDFGDGDDFLLTTSDLVGVDALNNMSGDEGYDYFGLTVEGEETVSLSALSGFEGLALEARHSDSIATLEAGSSDITDQVALLGRGTIVNQANIVTSDRSAVRLMNDYPSSGVNGIFGNGFTFENEGVISNESGTAIEVFDGQYGYYASSPGDFTVKNTGTISGDVYLGSGDDTFIQQGTLTGSVNLGNGDDLFILGANMDGVVDLGGGSNTFLVDVDTDTDLLIPEIEFQDTGYWYRPDLQAYGYVTSSVVSRDLSVAEGFDAVGIMVDGSDSSFEITGVEEGGTLPFLRLFGNGTVVNNVAIPEEADFANSYDVIEVPKISMMSDGLTLENNAQIDGYYGIHLLGNNQTLINNADLFRPDYRGDNTGNDGFITDAGAGNTIINNGEIVSEGFAMDALALASLDTHRPAGYHLDDDKTQVTTVINNGVLEAKSGRGFQADTTYALDLQNNGRISSVYVSRGEGQVTITNSETGLIGAISIDNNSYDDFMPTNGAIIQNYGTIGVNSSSGSSYLPTAINTSQYFYNTPDAAAENDTVINGGIIIGNVLLSDGEDTFTILDGSETLGLISGGAHEDTLLIKSSGSDLNIHNFSDFEHLDLSTDSIINIAARSNISEDFTDITVRNGQVLIDTDILQNVRVLEDGVLSGTSEIDGNVMSSGIIRPGDKNGVGKFIFEGNVELDSLSLFQIDELGTERDFVDFAGGVSPNGFVDLRVSGVDILDLEMSNYFNIDQSDGLFQQLNVQGSPSLMVALGQEAGVEGLFSTYAMVQGHVAIRSDINIDFELGTNTILSGNGTIIGDVATDGVIAPGASIGHLTITGDLTLGESSILEVEVEEGSTDVLTVNGNAALNGLLMVHGGSLAATQTHTFKFLNVSGTQSGGFDDYVLDTNDSFTGNIAVQQIGNGEVQLVLTPELAMDLSVSENAGQTTTFLNDLIATNSSTSQTDAIIEGLFSVGTDAVALENAIVSMESGVFAGAIAQGLEQARLVHEEVLTRAHSKKSETTGHQFWSNAIYSSLETDDDQYGADFELQNTGIMAGVEFLKPNHSFGLYAAYIDAEQDFLQRAAELEGEGLQVGVYGSWQRNSLHFDGALGYAKSSVDSQRGVAFLSEVLKSEIDLSTFSVIAQATYELGNEKFSFAPALRTSYFSVHRDGVQENGGNAALNVSEDITEFAYLDLGGEFGVKMSDALNVQFQAFYSYEMLGQTPDAKARFAGFDTNSYAGTIGKFERNRILVDSTVNYSLSDRFDLFGGFEVEAGETYSNKSIKVGLIGRF